MSRSILRNLAVIVARFTRFVRRGTRSGRAGATTHSGLLTIWLTLAGDGHAAAEEEQVRSSL